MSRGLQVGGLATQPLAVLGVPNTPERGGKSAVAHEWADCLHHPCRLGGPQRFRAGDKMSHRPQTGALTT